MALLLAGILALQWHAWSPDGALPDSPPARPTPAGIDARPATSAELSDAPPKEDYASVVERPLFLPERRPPPEEPEEAPVATEESDTALDGVDLSAVVITPAMVSAWVRGPQDTKLKRLRLGDPYLGWTVKTIEPGRLVLERQGETNELNLRDYANAPAPIPPTRLPPPTRRSPREDAPQDGSGSVRQRRVDGADAADRQKPEAEADDAEAENRNPVRQQPVRRTARPTPAQELPRRAPSR
jgi:general secretion pathway protein N